jgi:hypothetical protein
MKDQTRIGLAKVGPVKDKIKKIDGTGLWYIRSNQNIFHNNNNQDSVGKK